jgi:predicted DNA-binding transcriptional regulator YafY
LNDQAKIQRTLRLLMLLAGKRWYSAAEIQDRLEISTRTLYRYVQSLEQSGFVVERKPGQYRLASESGSMLTINRLLHFTEEEGYLLYKTLGLLQGEGSARDRLLRKLHTLYDCQILAKPQKQHTLEMVAALQKAIDKKQQCLLHQYRSNHSQTITDRTVEPFAFTENYEGIWAFDVETKNCKQFKLARIEKVSITPHGWANENQHSIPFTDAFGFAANMPKGIAHLRMNLLAANLLREEYPLCEKHIISIGDVYEVKLPFAHVKGIGRFIRGLREEIEVVGPVGLKRYLEGGG